jgi:hypothetical protein
LARCRTAAERHTPTKTGVEVKSAGVALLRGRRRTGKHHQRKDENSAHPIPHSIISHLADGREQRWRHRERSLPCTVRA